MKKKSKLDMTISHRVDDVGAFRKKRGRKSFFLQEMREEMRKVSWTTREEIVVCAKIVVGAIFAFGLGIYIIDLLVRNILLGINVTAHFILG